MTADTDPLIQKLDRVVNEVLAYFAGPGRTNAARVDRWQARDVLQHFLYFHDATAWGIESTAMVKVADRVGMVAIPATICRGPTVARPARSPKTDPRTVSEDIRLPGNAFVIAAGGLH